MSLYVVIRDIKSVAIAILFQFINYELDLVAMVCIPRKKVQHKKLKFSIEKGKIKNSLFVIKYEKLTFEAYKVIEMTKSSKCANFHECIYSFEIQIK